MAARTAMRTSVSPGTGSGRSRQASWPSSITTACNVHLMAGTEITLSPQAAIQIFGERVRVQRGGVKVSLNSPYSVEAEKLAILKSHKKALMQQLFPPAAEAEA